MNRWIVVAGAILIQLSLGAIYAWSAFTAPLQGTAANPSQYNFTKTETQAIFSAGLATFAVVMVIAGRLQQKIAPRIVALGGILLGAGYIAAGFTGASFVGKLLTIGIVGGAGIGFAYVVPIAVGVKWFPDKKGLLSGLAVAGFGFGAFIWIMLASPPAVLGIQGMIQTKNGIYAVANIDWVFIVYGIIFLALIVAGSLVMVNPPAGYKPAGWVPSRTKGQEGSGKQWKRFHFRRDVEELAILRRVDHVHVWCPCWPDGHRKCAKLRQRFELWIPRPRLFRKAGRGLCGHRRCDLPTNT